MRFVDISIILLRSDDNSGRYNDQTKYTRADSKNDTGGVLSCLRRTGKWRYCLCGEVSPTGEKLFEVYAPEKDDLYLKSYVSGDYANGKWTADTKETLVYGGESAIELPFLFPDLHMDDFVTYDKGYIKTDQDVIFSEKDL